MDVTRSKSQYDWYISSTTRSGGLRCLVWVLKIIYSQSIIYLSGGDEPGRPGRLATFCYVPISHRFHTV